jgi:hypothetical protein
MANTPEVKPTTTAKSDHTIAKFVGHSGTRRVITAADQDGIIGVKGAAKNDLVWEPGNTKLDVTEAHAEVIDYLKSDPAFQVRTVTVDA